MKYTFTDKDYLLAHGKNPRGRGNWAFEVKGEHAISAEQYIYTHYGKTKYTVFWVDGFNLTLTEAKKQAAQMLAAAGVPAGTTVDVAP